MKQERVFSLHNNMLTPRHAAIVQEFPLQLLVNGREIATLIGSPHDLRFLVAGFLRLQGFVTSLDDFVLFSVCDEFGIANIRIKGELPEKLRPILTSGCGTGITFTLPATETTAANATTPRWYQPADVFSLMEQLARQADNYRQHGGIHSAAIGRNGELILYAEDLGRHNTFDRIAGEALFKGIELTGSVLVTSGRVSSEMVAKAALMGVGLIASRTSPTDMAVRLCQQAGICLIGYVRGEKALVYAGAHLLEQYQSNDKIKGVTGVILAGGSSRRMGTNKALLELEGVALIEHIYRKLATLFQEVIIVTNTPADYDFIPCRKVSDVFTAAGSIAGLHAGLVHSSFDTIFVTACDMPNLDSDLIRHLHSLHGEHAATIPFSQGGQEPLHAFYSRSCSNVFSAAIKQGDRKILEIIKQLDVKLIPWDRIKSLPGAAHSFLNVNTPEEFRQIPAQQ